MVEDRIDTGESLLCPEVLIDETRLILKSQTREGEAKGANMAPVEQIELNFSFRTQKELS